MMSNDSFSDALAEAEKAVAVVKDKRLREVAFGQILNHLLSTGIIGRKRKFIKKSRSKAKRAERITKEGTIQWLRELVGEKFFSKPKSSKAIREELNNRSHFLKPSDLTWPLQRLCHERILRRMKKPLDEGGKQVLHWVKW
jgi:hypothetical protein